MDDADGSGVYELPSTGYLRPSELTMRVSDLERALQRSRVYVAVATAVAVLCLVAAVGSAALAWWGLGQQPVEGEGQGVGMEPGIDHECIVIAWHGDTTVDMICTETVWPDNGTVAIP